MRIGCVHCQNDRLDELVSIVPDYEAGHWGYATCEPPWGDGGNHEAIILMLYAGGAAQRQLDPDTGTDGCEEDDRQAAELLMPGWDESDLRAR